MKTILVPVLLCFSMFWSGGAFLDAQPLPPDTRSVIGILTCKGEPLGNYDVHLIDVENQNFLKTTFSNSEGEFEFEDVEPSDTYLLRTGELPEVQILHTFSYSKNELFTVPFVTDNNKGPVKLPPLNLGTYHK